MQHHDLPQPGDVVAGKYTVERFLGRGGMGAVYVVSHRMTGKRLALKCLLPEHIEHADIVERFVREAQAAGRIQHRNVVDVFDVGREGSLLYIVMELLDGKPFSELLHDEALTLEETLGILVRAMEGVAAAHGFGIVHRDLKPDNILIVTGQTGRLDDPRVLDFGISKIDDDASQSLTRSGVAMGTPYYMSLEQMSGQRDLDARVDVYAMGVILYEAIAGQPPHVADSVSALAIKMLTTPPIHLAQIRPDLPAGLADVVMTALARDRDQRYPTMQALIDAIRPYVPQSAGLLVPEGQGRPLRTPRSGESSSPVRQVAPLSSPTTPRQSRESYRKADNPATPPAWVSGPMVSTPSGNQHRLAVESAATIAAPITPSRAPVVQAQIPAQRAEKRFSPVVAALGVLVVGAIVASAWWFARASTNEEARAAPPPPAPPVAAAPNPEPAQVEAPAPSLPLQGVNAQPQPTGAAQPEATAESSADHHGKGKKHGAKHEEAKTPTEATKQPEPEQPQVKGRAGALAPGDF
jgi:serine/threonine protein kinase